MIRSERFISTLICLIFFSLSGHSQNLYDQDNSRKFADYLLTSRQYQLASQELERIVIMEPKNLTAKKNLIFSYRQTGAYQTALNRLMQWYPKSDPDSLLAEEWIRTLLLHHSHNEAHAFLGRKINMSTKDILYYQMANNLLSGNWDAANQMIRKQDDYPGAIPSSMVDLVKEKQALKYKSPALALGLSALLPGMGKVYTLDWKDGIISLLFVATNAWQAYRGFSKDGVQSVYGWIFGTMAVGFYTSNLYGSWKSARDYNNNLDHELFHRIENTVYSDF